MNDNKKYFAVSDIHGYYAELTTALQSKGFDINNPNHILLSLGDEFDRGSGAVELLKFLQDLQKQNRLILIRWNHTCLMWDCLHEINVYKKPQGSHHYSNGTIGTIMQFTNDYNIIQKLNYWEKLNDSEMTIINNALSPWKDLVKNALNYFEIGNYIFVHGWIPFKSPTIDSYDNKIMNYFEGWRDIPDYSPLWDAAVWAGFVTAYKNKCFEPNKTIVCGHWHCSAYWGDIVHKYKPFPQKNRKNWQESFKPAITPEFIAIDACTAYSGLVNVLVFEEISQNNVILLA